MLYEVVSVFESARGAMKSLSVTIQTKAFNLGSSCTCNVSFTFVSVDEILKYAHLQMKAL